MNQREGRAWIKGKKRKASWKLTGRPKNGLWCSGWWCSGWWCSACWQMIPEQFSSHCNLFSHESPYQSKLHRHRPVDDEPWCINSKFMVIEARVIITRNWDPMWGKVAQRVEDKKAVTRVTFSVATTILRALVISQHIIAITGLSLPSYGADAYPSIAVTMRSTIIGTSLGYLTLTF